MEEVKGNDNVTAGEKGNDKIDSDDDIDKAGDDGNAEIDFDNDDDGKNSSVQLPF